MLSINNFFVNLWRLVLDFFFPHPSDVQTFLELDNVSLEKLAHAHHDQTNSIHSLFIYRTSLIRSAIRDLKYYKNTVVAKRFSPILARHISTHTTDKDYILVPLPASKRRMHTYGFNQCLFITEALAPLLGDKCSHRPDCLKRSDSQTSQTKLAKRDRLANVHGAFVASGELRGKHVIIIDDVWTTGATASEAISACRAVGSQSIAVWTIAH